MGLFSKKRKDAFFTENEQLTEEPHIHSVTAPAHMLTPDEILSDFGERAETGTSNAESGALERMRQRMLGANVSLHPELETAHEDKRPEPEHNSESAAFKNGGAENAAPEFSEKEKTAAESRKTAESAVDFMSLFSSDRSDAKPRQTGEETSPKGPVQPKADGFARAELNAAQESEMIKSKGDNAANAPKTPVQPQPADEKESLLHKCMPYIVDDEGKDASVPSEPLYRLESVADILRSNSEDTLSRLSKKYGITFDDLGKKPAASATEEHFAPSGKNGAEKTEEKPPQKVIEIEPDENGKITINGEPLVFDDELPQISDIDNNTSPLHRQTAESAPEQATVRFTPVKEPEDGGERMSVSTTTRTIDITGELSSVSSPEKLPPDETQLEESEFEAFSPGDTVNSPADFKRVNAKYMRLRRRAFIQTFLSVLLLAAGAALLLPVFSDILIRSPRTAMIYITGITGLAAVINFDIFASLGSVLSRRTRTDAPVALSALSAAALGVCSAVSKQSCYGVLLSALLILAVRAFCRFKWTSAMCGNLRQAFSQKPKKAVTLITDEPTAFAMAKSAVEGDALIAAPRDTETVTDFMKYAEYSPAVGGRLRSIVLAAVLIAAAAGLAAGALFHSAVSGVYCAAVILSAAACPALLCSESLPLSAAASRLNKKGSMIAGKAGADRLELANAAVISSNDIFPDGTVVMQSMKVLSENSFDENILRAASLSEAAGSPLAPIFKRIAGTGAGYTIPDSETVKYEDRLGISGWVDDQMVFIGNRTLMQAHGIAVPDVETDKKILRRGYFPVYLGVNDKACALLIIRYDVEPQVVYELRKLTGLGVTLLVNNCDPNLTEEMICDYLGLYSDSVKVMSNSGVHMFKNAVVPCKSCSAPAVFRGNPLNFISVLNCAAKIKRSVRLLSVFYIIAAVIGTVLFTYLSFLVGSAPVAGLAPVGDMPVLAAHAGTLLLSLILFLISKP